MAATASGQAAAFASSAGFDNCGCKEAAELTSSGAYTYADVRTPEEFAAGHPPGAINVPVMLTSGGGMSPNPLFLSQFEQAFPDKGAQLAVGCASGKRSAMAASQLAQAGYVGLVNVEGGFSAWQSLGLPVSK
jgi:rhodanese-related sulfurtransferase